ncbi:copper amine oxidase N-terminal domain-containing protein [Brevibacillus sp. B_LB10_24]|uniref:copper amine oxidase N-terminal domain-containing protein n=1 Tax=Brevibacillus sp. B_LB10_24 TaxID=3380645 RepID=UPI0038B9CE8F
MKLWVYLLLISLMVFFAAVPVMAADPIQIPVNTIIPDIVNQQIGPQQIQLPVNQTLANPPILVAFSAIANRFTNVDPATVFDLDGDLTGDLSISSTTVTGKNGALVQLLNPAQLNLDQVQSVPANGYSASAPLQLNRVYVSQLPGGGYVKFMILQASPKVTIWFHFGRTTTSELKADGTGGHTTLTWGALPDAALGYNLYRYEIGDNNSYTVTQLNDFTIQQTSFVDNTAQKHYYIYAVQAVKSGGTPGSLTTAAAVFVQSLQRSLTISLTTDQAKLDGSKNLKLDAKPVIKHGWMMVPATVFSSTGTNVAVDGSTGHLTLTRKIGNVTYRVEMTIDDTDYTWNGTKFTTDVPPYKSGSVVMVPLRVVSPVLGLGVTFNSVDRTATIQWAE